MIDLKDTTFIIPIRVESADRTWNIQYTIGYLCRNLETNIFIWESSKTSHVAEILKRIRPFKTKITHWFEKTDDPTFHRTRLLNEMLWEVKTPVVVNYDCDIILQPSSYSKARNAVLAGGDLVYPYFFGKSQRKIYRHTMVPDITEELKHEEAQSEY